MSHQYMASQSLASRTLGHLPPSGFSRNINATNNFPLPLSRRPGPSRPSNQPPRTPLNHAPPSVPFRTIVTQPLSSRFHPTLASIPQGTEAPPPPYSFTTSATAPVVTSQPTRPSRGPAAPPYFPQPPPNPSKLMYPESSVPSTPSPRSQLPVEVRRMSLDNGQGYNNSLGNLNLGQFNVSTTNFLKDNVPQGLQVLATLDQLIVNQKVAFFGLFIGCELRNEYQIWNHVGLGLFNAQEETNCFVRNFFGSCRPFTMSIKDSYGQEVIRLERPFKCCFPMCCPLTPCLQIIEVYSSETNERLGSVHQIWSCLEPAFIVKDEGGKVALKIQGPFCTASCCGKDVVFEVVSLESLEPVGKISKRWSGLAKEIFTDADSFGIRFPVDMNVKLKATLLGACLLIDFMYFESSHN